MEDRLQKFAKVVEAGGITRAARELRISQPALSTAIHKLERELKTELLQRHGRTVRITPAGQFVYHTACTIRAKLQDLAVDLTEHQQQKPHFRLGMIDSLAELLCIKGNLLQNLEATANVSLTVNNSGYLTRAVMQGKAELAFAAKQPDVSAAILRLTPVGSEPLMLVVRRTKLAGLRSQLELDTLPHFLAYNPGSNTYDLIANHLDQLHFRPDIVFYSTSPEVILQLVLAGRGIAALPFQMVQQQLQDNTLCLLPVRVPIISRPIVALEEKGRKRSAAAEVCLRQASQALRQLSRDANKQH